MSEWQQEPPFSVQIEPTEGCNLRCGFCGIHGIREKGEAGNLSGPYKHMTEETASRLGNQMYLHGWNPRLEFAMHGEPTMHPNLPKLINIFRIALPRVSIMLTTNGIPMLDDLHGQFDALFAAGVNTIALDDYRPHLVAEQARAYGRQWAAVYEYPEQPEGNPHRRTSHRERRVVIIADISQTDTGTHAVLGNHAGAAKAPNDSAAGKRCARPFRELSVRWDGNIAICCNDWRGTFKVGNVHDAELPELWNSAHLNAARRFLLQGDRASVQPCVGCDHTTYRNGLLPDKYGKEDMGLPTEADKQLVADAASEGTYTPVVLRYYEKAK